MRTYYLRDIDEPDWAPLCRLAELLRSEACDLPTIEPDDFMYMARIYAKGHPDIHLYKHYDTRCYLNLDDEGHAYEYVPQRDDGDRGRRRPNYMGRYRPHPDLASALLRLDLHLLEDSAWADDY